MEKNDYVLIRSKRKTLAIHILEDARVEVRAPLRMPLSVIEAFVASRMNWIEAHLKTARIRLEQKKKYSAGEGENVLFLGKNYRVHLVDRADASMKENYFILPVDEIQRRTALTEWYRQQAENQLLQIAEKWKSFTGIEWRKLSIGNAASRWGSCNNKNDIRLSWRLILLPEEVVDYVIVHELCHTLEHNHSANFWAKVKSFLPDSRERRRALRQFECEYQNEISWL